MDEATQWEVVSATAQISESARGQDKPQRVLLKFGDWHVYKGINPLRQRDLGNFVAELADGRNGASLHILVLGAKGTHALYAGYAGYDQNCASCVWS